MNMDSPNKNGLSGKASFSEFIVPAAHAEKKMTRTTFISGRRTHMDAAAGTMNKNNTMPLGVLSLSAQDKKILVSFQRWSTPTTAVSSFLMLHCLRRHKDKSWQTYRTTRYSWPLDFAGRGSQLDHSSIRLSIPNMHAGDQLKLSFHWWSMCREP